MVKKHIISHNYKQIQKGFMKVFVLFIIFKLNKITYEPLFFTMFSSRSLFNFNLVYIYKAASNLNGGLKFIFNILYSFYFLVSEC